MSDRRIKGIITKGVGGLYTVRPLRSDPDAGGELLCSARGKFRLEGISPLPGDFVTVERDTDSPGAADEARFVITDIEKRRNVLIRPPLSNLTHIFMIIPSCRPKPDLLTADKLIAISESLGIEPVVVVGKADLDPVSAAELEGIYKTAGYRVFVISSTSGEGCGALARYIADLAGSGKDGETVRTAFAGVSGAGKSTLLSRLFPSLDLATGDLSRKTERGRHTTRATELFPVEIDGRELFFADTPGFSMLDFTRFNFFPPEDLPLCFREFADCIGKCRYGGCTHVREEGCAVIAKMEAGGIARSRHDSYVAIRDEIRKKPAWKREKEEKAKNRV